LNRQGYKCANRSDAEGALVMLFKMLGENAASVSDEEDNDANGKLTTMTMMTAMTMRIINEVEDSGSGSNECDNEARH
jgi:hypothetical protein